MSEPSTESRKPTRSPMSRSEWALLLVLVAIHFTHMVDFVIIMPLGERLMNELSITPWQFGQIVAVYALSAGIASLLASFAMDRFDRKSVLLVMYAGFASSTLFCGLAWNYPMLLLSRTLAGVFGGLAAVAIMAVIGDVFPPEKRGRAAGAISSSFAVASILGLPLGLLLADWYGRGAPFIVLAAFSAVVWVIACFRLPQVRGHLTAVRSHAFIEFMQVLRNPNHVRAYLFSLFLVLGTFTVASFIAPYFSATNGWTEKNLAQMYLAAGVCTLVGMNIVGYLADRFPRLLLFRILGTACIVMGLVVTNLPQTSLFVATLVMSGFMVTAAGRFVPAQAMILGAAEDRVRGAFMSLNTAVQHLATGIAPVIAGSLIVKGDDGKMTGFPLVGLVATAAAVVALILAGRLRTAPRQEPVRIEPVRPEPTADNNSLPEPIDPSPSEACLSPTAG